MMTFAYYLAGTLFVSLTPFVSTPGIAAVLGLYYLLNTPIGDALNPYPAHWYFSFIVLDAAMAAFFLMPRDGLLYFTSIAFAFGALLTGLTYAQVSPADRLYGTLSMLVNTAIIVPALLYLWENLKI